MFNPWRWHWKTNKTQITTKPTVLSEITHAQLLECQVPEPLPVTWENALLLTSTCIRCLLPNPLWLSPGGRQLHGSVPFWDIVLLVSPLLPPPLPSFLQRCCHWPRAAPGHAAFLRSPGWHLRALACCFSSGCPKRWPYLSCFLQFLSAELRGSPGGAGLPEHSGPPAGPCPLRLGLFLLQPDFLTIYSYWSEDWFPPGGSSCWTKIH